MFFPCHSGSQRQDGQFVFNSQHKAPPTHAVTWDQVKSQGVSALWEKKEVGV